MKVEITEEAVGETIVQIKCRQYTQKIHELKSYIELYNNKLIVKMMKDTYCIKSMDIFHLETIDNKVFIYLEHQVIELNERLYKIEDKLDENVFFRASKFQIFNIHHVIKIEPELNRTLIITLSNDEKINLSRKYSKIFKNALHL